MACQRAKIAVIMITYNEAHNMHSVLENLEGFADEVLVLDSFSTDNTVQIAREYGAKVYQRFFDGFGNQWNYAVSELPVKSTWTMKLDPDEHLSVELKQSILNAVSMQEADGFFINRRLWFMGKQLPVYQKILRIWKTGTCRFSDVSVNEHPIVEGNIKFLSGNLEHHDSPNLHHWVNKQNNYTSAEANSKFEQQKLSCGPSLFSDSMARRMWLKTHFSKLPFRHQLVFMYCYIIQGAWRAGRVGYIWARLRSDVYRMREYKLLELSILPSKREAANISRNTRQRSVKDMKA